MRRTTSDGELLSEDSFLDIIANMVGILIILVMVVGARVSRSPALSEPDTEPSSTDVAERTVPDPDPTSSRAAVQSVFSETKDLAGQVVAMQRELLFRDQERDALNVLVVGLDQTLKEQRASLDGEDRDQLELRAKLTNAQLSLEELAREQMAVESEPGPVEKIQNLPTPLAQTVHGEEVHLRLSGGQVSVIPVEILLDALTADAEQNLWKLEQNNAATGVVGPIDGFRMRYRLVRGILVSRSSSGAIQRGTAIQLDRWELLPTEADLGEPAEQAMLPHSPVSRALAGLDPDRTTITIWTYPDSFAQFRSLKKALFDRGYAIAGRPLPEGVRIAGSPRGSRSAAQ